MCDFLFRTLSLHKLIALYFSFLVYEMEIWQLWGLIEYSVAKTMLPVCSCQT